MTRKLALIVLIGAMLSACAAGQPNQPEAVSRKTIVVTYSILGSVVRDLVEDRAEVVVPMPNGQDPHEWEPSAKDIETIMHANLIVQNGLGLEGGMQNTLEQSRSSGVKFFTASDHIRVRKVGAGEGIPNSDPDQAVGADDPHLWMDPLAMKQIVDALAAQIESDLGIDVSQRAADLDSRLDSLNQEVSTTLSTVPEAQRKLVTGHESLGYFAQRYHFKLVGAIIPSLTSDAQVSASDLAALKELIKANQVKAIFTELGTPQSVADAIGQDAGVKVVKLATHTLPEDGSYFTFLRNMAQAISDALR